MKELLDLPFQNRDIHEPTFVSASANALVPQLWKSPSPTHFLCNYVEEQWTIHPPPVMSHF